MRYKLSGFTLIEVLIAMLLFVIAAAGLLTLFPVAHRTERESVQETRASLIASGIMVLIRSGPCSMDSGDERHRAGFELNSGRRNSVWFCRSFSYIGSVFETFPMTGIRRCQLRSAKLVRFPRSDGPSSQ